MADDMLVSTKVIFDLRLYCRFISNLVFYFFDFYLHNFKIVVGSQEFVWKNGGWVSHSWNTPFTKEMG